MLFILQSNIPAQHSVLEGLQNEEKGPPSIGRMFFILRNQEEEEFIFSQIGEVRILKILSFL